ncbi:hypothetical protein [Myxacorys almedinensis]|nr:hypothetical protein [Myxacorys almedinensis]
MNRLKCGHKLSKIIPQWAIKWAIEMGDGRRVQKIAVLIDASDAT